MRVHTIAALLFASLILSSCQELFTTSLAAGLARNSDSVYADVEIKDFDAAIESAVSSIEDTLALMHRIEVLADGAQGSDAIACARAAAELAGPSLGLVPLIVSIFDTQSSEDEVDIGVLIDDAISTMSHLGEVSEILAAVIPEPGTSDWDDFVAVTDSSSLIFSGVVLVFSQIPESESPAEWLANLDLSDPDLEGPLALGASLVYAAFDEPPEDILSALFAGFFPQD